MGKLVKELFFCAYLLSFTLNSTAQNDVCNLASRYCTDSTYNFPAPVSGLNAEVGPDYGCLGSQPNPTWYYFQITNPGSIVINIAGADAFLDDVDFACWGPFDSLTLGCNGGLTANCDPIFGCSDNTSPLASYPAGNLTDCSFDSQATEICTINNSVVGHYYILMVTNYGGNVTNIILTQTNVGQTGAGSANCGNGNIGLDNVFKKKQIELYPNPNKGNFTISLGNINEIVSLKITNLLGEKIHEQRLSSNTTELNLDFNAGVYLISVDGENTNLQYKVIVE